MPVAATGRSSVRGVRASYGHKSSYAPPPDGRRAADVADCGVLTARPNRRQCGSRDTSGNHDREVVTDTQRPIFWVEARFRLHVSPFSRCSTNWRPGARSTSSLRTGARRRGACGPLAPSADRPSGRIAFLEDLVGNHWYIVRPSQELPFTVAAPVLYAEVVSAK